MCVSLLLAPSQQSQKQAIKKQRPTLRGQSVAVLAVRIKLHPKRGGVKSTSSANECIRMIILKRPPDPSGKIKTSQQLCHLHTSQPTNEKAKSKKKEPAHEITTGISNCNAAN